MYWHQILCEDGIYVFQVGQAHYSIKEVLPRYSGGDIEMWSPEV